MVHFRSLISPFPFYTYIKRIFEHHEQATGPSRAHLLECGALTLFILRFVALQLALNYHQTSHLSCDPMAQFLHHYRHIYEGYIFLSLAWLAVYALLTNWLFFLKTWENPSFSRSNRSALSWQAVAYDLIVRNVDQARQCTNQSLNHDRSTRLFNHQSIKQNRETTKWGFKYSSLGSFHFFFGFLSEHLSMEQLDLGKLCRRQLVIFSFLSVKHRKAILQLHRLFSVSSRLFQATSYFPILLGMLSFLILTVPAVAYPKTLSLSGWLLLLNDLLLIFIYGWPLFRNVLLFVYLGQLHSAAYRWHLGASHRLLAYLSRKYGARCAQSLGLWNRLLLKNLLTEHAHICALLDATNRQLTSQAALALLLSGGPANIYLIYRVIYVKILLSEFAVTILFTAAQILCVACAFVPLAQANGALYRTGKYLPAIQLYVLRGGSNRSLKIKYEILQSTLTESRVKSGTTIGPVCLITFESLSKVVTLYAVYMLAFFDLLPK